MASPKAVAQDLELKSANWFLLLSVTVAVTVIEKRQDVERFSTVFLNCDQLAKHWVPYGKIYLTGEALAGVLTTLGILGLSGPSARLACSWPFESTSAS